MISSREYGSLYLNQRVLSSMKLLLSLRGKLDN